MAALPGRMINPSGRFHYIYLHKFAILSYMKSLSPSQPHVIIMVGIPGSGKSFFAEKFAETFHAPYISSGAIQNLGQTTPSLADALSHAFFKEVCKTSQSIVFDGNTDARVDRMKLAQIAKQAGYETLLVWVQTDPVTAKARSTRGTKARPGTMSDDSFERALKNFTPPNTIEKPLVISGKHTFATQAKMILKRLSQPRSSILNTAEITPERPQPRSKRTVFIR
jgi:predicted kinase